MAKRKGLGAQGYDRTDHRKRESLLLTMTDSQYAGHVSDADELAAPHHCCEHRTMMLDLEQFAEDCSAKAQG
jgi:hypothetical protein